MQKNYNAFVKWIAISAVVVFVGIFLIFRVGNEEYTLETFFGDIGFTTGIVVFFCDCFQLLVMAATVHRQVVTYP